MWLSSSDTYNWATRPGESWPCSDLRGNRVFVEFDSAGDLVDLAINGKGADVDGHELSACVSDFLRAKYPDHPAIRA